MASQGNIICHLGYGTHPSRFATIDKLARRIGAIHCHGVGWRLSEGEQS